MYNKDILKAKIKLFVAAVAKDYVQYILTWTLLLFLVIIIEQVRNGFLHEWPNNVWVFVWSIVNTLVFSIKSSALLFPFFLVLYIWSKKVASIFITALISVATFANLLLIIYFSTALVPLGADLYSYSLSDITQTTASSGIISVGNTVGILLVVIVIYSIMRFVRKRINPSALFSKALLLSILIFAFFNVGGKLKATSFSSEYFNSLILNKLGYFSSASNSYFFGGEDDVDIYADNYIGNYGELSKFSQSINYTDPEEYPFLHQPDSADVLSPFIKPGKTPPNLVFIVVEGLGRAFTNDGAYLGNFTPFIDSLSKKSIYWPNFLSEGGRTFAMLPSVMGSLPFGKAGFLDMGKKMPDHLSLYSILKHNGYHTSFYYGGNADFDNMANFLTYNQVDEIKDLNTFPNGYIKMPQSSSGFSWGYQDDQLFKYYLQSQNAALAKQPELSVILTLSTHDPFLMNNEQRYIDMFENRMKTLEITEDKKESYRKYKLQYSSVMYLDESLKHFFDGYKKRADFSNTIFFITGDHRMPEIPTINKIDRYHVPFIIYSPLLKRTARIESISTHFDITPSVLSYLKTNYAIETPSKVAWLGTGLDTVQNFRNIHSYPLIQTKSDLTDFVMGEYHINGDQFFKMNNYMQEDNLEDKSNHAKLTQAFSNFKRKNNLVKEGVNNILPDSLVKKFRSPKK
ncbi:LTA synthase family protein [Pedobacter changchengzhani]|uniref:LTA synthase family protein n=1 Tax=Pedobacter changchengzhani TaxID=2529274 RepID=A0A4R5MKG5_9SPHI|nr:LTA synthase family protein [Pedobacter changchengzhani]TDG36131.1 LTA synthase family protein [Pedobacter changchengzhani]